MTRIIQVPIDPDLLTSLDRLSQERSQPRAALIREACRRYIADERARALDDAYEQGYRRRPESPALGEAQASLAAQVLEPETW